MEYAHEGFMVGDRVRLKARPEIEGTIERLANGNLASSHNRLRVDWDCLRYEGKGHPSYYWSDELELVPQPRPYEVTVKVMALDSNEAVAWVRDRVYDAGDAPVLSVRVAK